MMEKSRSINYNQKHKGIKGEKYNEHERENAHGRTVLAE